MNALIFDTLAFARRLEAAGFSRGQAEALAEEQARLIDDRLATKADIAAVRSDIEAQRLATERDIAAVRGDIEAQRLATARDIEALRLSTTHDIEALRQSTTREIDSLRQSTRSDLAEMKSDLLKWLVGTVGLQTVVILGAVLALMRLLPH